MCIAGVITCLRCARYIDCPLGLAQSQRQFAPALLIAGIITPVSGLWVLAEYRLVDLWGAGYWRLGTTVLTAFLIVHEQRYEDKAIAYKELSLSTNNINTLLS